VVKRLVFLLEILLQEARQRNFILKSFVLGFAYLVFALIFFDFKTYESILSQTYSLSSKIYICFLLFVGSFSILGLRDSILVILIALLFGLNLELVLRKLKFLKSRGNLHITLGAGLISLFSAGCASCGLSFASVIGVASVVSMLPYHGLLLYLLSILVLVVSLLYNLQTLVRVCKLK
jgi:hypothetical protein